jgi:threonine dehydrogenase-like Zn-dependent dehydrogenase
MMQAITVAPGIAGSARLEAVPEPPLSDGALLVRTLALGVCGTDREIISGEYGWAPSGETRLILGHESLGVVEDAPASSAFAIGDLVVGIVRRPDPVPCRACAVGEWDMCLNGDYTERGIKQRNGYGAERFRLEPEFAVRVDPALGSLGVLLEPASVLAKAWDHIEKIGARSKAWPPKTLMVTGAGPIGLLAALMGAQRGLSVHVLNRHDSPVKSALVKDLGATFHTDGISAIDRIGPDVLIECTGAPQLIRDILGRSTPGEIICLTGVTTPGHGFDFDIGRYNRNLVLNNNVVFGTVNANRQHYQMAATALKEADKAWLGRLITRRIPVARWSEALESQPEDIKVIIEFSP